MFDKLDDETNQNNNKKLFSSGFVFKCNPCAYSICFYSVCWKTVIGACVKIWLNEKEEIKTKFCLCMWMYHLFWGWTFLPIWLCLWGVAKNISQGRAFTLCVAWRWALNSLLFSPYDCHHHNPTPYSLTPYNIFLPFDKIPCGSDPTSAWKTNTITGGL